MPEVRYLKAVNQALYDAMEADDTVFVIGEDVAAAGGPFKATRGLLETFGPGRVYDAPIAEAVITGVAVGAAMTGMRPGAEIMFMGHLVNVEILVQKFAVYLTEMIFLFKNNIFHNIIDAFIL